MKINVILKIFTLLKGHIHVLETMITEDRIKMGELINEIRNLKNEIKNLKKTG
jgi:hypothetical protein